MATSDATPIRPFQTATQRDTERALLTKERRELAEEPEEELAELAQLYVDKGLTADLARQVAVQLTPLYHAVELLRSLTTGVVGPAVLLHVAYLGVFGSVAMVLARRRLAVKLVK